MTPLNVQESLFGKLPVHWTNLMPSSNLHTNSYISATVHHYKILYYAWTTCGYVLVDYMQQYENARALSSARVTTQT